MPGERLGECRDLNTRDNPYGSTKEIFRLRNNNNRRLYRELTWEKRVIRNRWFCLILPLRPPIPLGILNLTLFILSSCRYKRNPRTVNRHPGFLQTFENLALVLVTETERPFFIEACHRTAIRQAVVCKRSWRADIPGSSELRWTPAQLSFVTYIDTFYGRGQTNSYWLSQRML